MGIRTGRSPLCAASSTRWSRLRGNRWRPRTSTSILAARAAVERAAAAVAVSVAGPCAVSPEGSPAKVLATAPHAEVRHASSVQQHTEQDYLVVTPPEVADQTVAILPVSQQAAALVAPCADGPAPGYCQTPPLAVLQPHAPFVEPRAHDEQLAEGLRAVITQMVAVSSNEYRMTCFHAVRPPAMSIQDYFARIQRFFGCSGSCYVLGLLYLDRLMKRHPDYGMSSLSVHRLLITSIMVAAKFNDDVFYSNAYYAKVGGVKIPEINGLEFRFVQLLNWELHVQPEEYEVYEKILLKAAAASM